MTSYAAFPEELKSAIGLLVAFVLGTVIGAERQYRQRTAGLRTALADAVSPTELPGLYLPRDVNVKAVCIAWPFIPRCLVLHCQMTGGTCRMWSTVSASDVSERGRGAVESV